MEREEGMGRSREESRVRHDGHEMDKGTTPNTGNKTNIHIEYSFRCSNIWTHRLYSRSVWKRFIKQIRIKNFLLMVLISDVKIKEDHLYQADEPMRTE